MEIDNAIILDSISKHLGRMYDIQEKAAKIPVYWKEIPNIDPHSKNPIIKRLVCFASKGDLEQFMYGKWLKMEGGHMIARAMAEHVLFYEIDGVEFLLEANRSFAEKQKSLGQKHRDF